MYSRKVSQTPHPVKNSGRAPDCNATICYDRSNRGVGYKWWQQCRAVGPRWNYKSKVKAKKSLLHPSSRQGVIQVSEQASAVLMSPCLNAPPNELFKSFLTATPFSTQLIQLLHQQRGLAPARFIWEVLGSILDPQASYSDYGLWYPRNEEFKKKLYGT
jgi:hypothetical protein